MNTPHPSTQFCIFCGARLDVQQAVRGGACSDPVCRKKLVVAQVVGRRKEEMAAVRRAAVNFRARVAPTLGVSNPEALALAIVPYFNRPAVKLPAPRWRKFHAHLFRVVRQAFAEELNKAGVASLAKELSEAVTRPASSPFDGVCCATCRGHCCREGGAHAYLDVTVIRSYLARHPGLRWRTVVEAFLRQLPARAFADSCAYHGRRGCALPPEMRSATCNQYYCEGLKELRLAVGATFPKTLLIVSASGADIKRSTLVREDGARRVVR